MVYCKYHINLLVNTDILLKVHQATKSYPKMTKAALRHCNKQNVEVGMKSFHGVTKIMRYVVMC